MSLFKKYTTAFIKQNLVEKSFTDYNWKKDQDFLRYLTYRITLDLFARGVFPGNKDNAGVVSYTTDLVSKYSDDNLLPPLSIEDVEEFNKLGVAGDLSYQGHDIGDESPDNKIYSHIHDADVRDYIQRTEKGIIEKYKESKQNSSSSLKDYLPETWSDEEKDQWIKTRISKYIASFIPMKPWRVKLNFRRGSHVGSTYLDDGTAQNGGWALFRDKSDAEEAAHAFLSRPMSAEDRQNYLNGLVGPWRQTIEEYHPELTYFVELINKNLPALQLDTELTPQEVKSLYNQDLSKEPYANQELNDKLNSLVIPKLQQLAADTREYYKTHKQQLADALKSSDVDVDNEGASND